MQQEYINSLDKAINGKALSKQERETLKKLKEQLLTAQDNEQILQTLMAIVRLIGIASNFTDFLE